MIIEFRKPKWRNGRRAGFKIRYSQGCVGSSPTFGIDRNSDPRSEVAFFFVTDTFG